MIRPRALPAFTLAELIVSVGIFAVIMLAATSAYFNLISLDRQARSTNGIVNNLSFAVDAMMRGIRTGNNYQCLDPAGAPDSNGNSTNGACSCFSYTDTNLGQTVTYHLQANHAIGRTVGTGSCLDSLSSSITDPAITISSGGLVFWVRGAGGNTNDTQSQVLFTVKGTMPAGSLGSGTASTTTFILEEDATQRLIDL